MQLKYKKYIKERQKIIFKVSSVKLRQKIYKLTYFSDSAW